MAEKRRVPYVFAAYCPAVLPSAHHAPPQAAPPGATPNPTTTPGPAERAALWARDAERFNAMFGPALDAHRAAMGLPAVADVRSHVFSDQPWLAADPTLAPWPEPTDPAVFQTGAWILPDERPSPPRSRRSSTPATRPSTSASAASARRTASARR